MKKCNKCKIEKELIKFCKNKSRKGGYQHQCKECDRQYRIANADYYTQYKKQHRKDNPEYYTQYIKQWLIDNPEYYKQWCIDNPAKLIQYGKERSKTPQGKLMMRIKANKRRTLKLQNTPIGKHFIPADIILKLKLQHGKCVYCQVSIKKYYEIDHIIPLCKGGSNEASNIQLLCKKCNSMAGKGSKLPHEFAKKHNMLF